MPAAGYVTLNYFYIVSYDSIKVQFIYGANEHIPHNTFGKN